MTKNPEKICLVCMDRTGSNMVSSRLHTHPDICFYNEVFHRQYVIFQDDRVNGSAAFVQRRDRNPAAFVSQLWNGEFEPKETRAGIKAIGFKLFVNHNAEALKYVVNSGAKIVFLRRRNPLLRFSSFKIATKTGEWKTSKGSDKAVKIQFHPTEFRAYYNNYLSLETLFEMSLTRWNVPFFDLWYEDLVGQEEVWPNLVRYLGYQPEEFGGSTLVRQNTTDPLARFHNPDDVREFATSLGKLEWLNG